MLRKSTRCVIWLMELYSLLISSLTRTNKLKCLWRVRYVAGTKSCWGSTEQNYVSNCRDLGKSKNTICTTTSTERAKTTTILGSFLRASTTFLSQNIKLFIWVSSQKAYAMNGWLKSRPLLILLGPKFMLKNWALESLAKSPKESSRLLQLEISQLKTSHCQYPQVFPIFRVLLRLRRFRVKRIKKRKSCRKNCLRKFRRNLFKKKTATHRVTPHP